MDLKQLLDYDNIIIQCHNTPDADALACGFVLLDFFRSNDKNAMFIYGGQYEVKKSNLVMMMDELGIEAYHVKKQEDLSRLLRLKENEIPDLLLMVDCQRQGGNIQDFEAKEYAVIDHHELTKPQPPLSEIRPELESCATLVWDMVSSQGVDINQDSRLATALYYGLMTDSGNFAQVAQDSLDSQMRDTLNFDPHLINRFKSSNISQEDLKIAAVALLGAEYYSDHRYAIVKAEPCDPNVLGIVSDIVVEVDNIECCLCYTMSDMGVKISVRSCINELKANELAAFICQDVGDGGGHVIKAGGFIERKLLEKKIGKYNLIRVQDYCRQKMREYFAMP